MGSDTSINENNENGTINLIDKTLLYKDGFQIADDFTLKIKGSALNRNGSIITLKNKEKKEVEISGIICPDNSVRYKLTVPNSVSRYILYTSPLFLSSKDNVTIVLRRIHQLYQIKAYKEGGNS